MFKNGRLSTNGETAIITRYLNGDLEDLDREDAEQFLKRSPRHVQFMDDYDDTERMAIRNIYLDPPVGELDYRNLCLRIFIDPGADPDLD